jgi:HsdM N-terminal domain
MFEQTFKNIDDVLWKEAGCATELDYTEQTSWILFLKYLDDLEHANAQKAELQGKTYTYIIDKAHRWSVWAAPKKKDGSFDHDKALTGDDLIKFVDEKLFPYLKGFRTRAEGPNTVEYKIGEIFSEIETSSAAAIRCATRWNWSISSASAHSRTSTSCRTSTRPSSATWAMRGATAASITRRVR